jgi:hypothetical protein
MTERDSRRQAGSQFHHRDGLDDRTWAFNAANAASLGAFPFGLNDGTPVLSPAEMPTESGFPRAGHHVAIKSFYIINYEAATFR